MLTQEMDTMKEGFLGQLADIAIMLREKGIEHVSVEYPGLIAIQIKGSATMFVGMANGPWAWGFALDGWDETEGGVLQNQTDLKAIAAEVAEARAKIVAGGGF